MLFLDNRFSVDASLNLALEEAIFRLAKPEEEIFMLWQNKRAVVVGRNQIIESEVDLDYARAGGIQTVRRLSGGGAVYHDMGNLNFTYITDLKGDAGFERLSRPIVKALADLGLEVEVSGRNDLTLGGRKISGTAQYVHADRILHHGSILFDSDLETLVNVLTPSEIKLSKRGVKSVKQRVTNLKEHLENVVSMDGLRARIVQTLNKEYNTELLRISPEIFSLTDRLMRRKYSQNSWNLGKKIDSGAKSNTVSFGFGEVTVSFRDDLGIIRDFSLSGDFFSLEDITELESAFEGTSVDEFYSRAAGIDIGKYIKGMDLKTFSKLFGGAYGHK